MTAEPRDREGRKPVEAPASGSRFDIHDASAPSLVTLLFADIVSSTAQIAAMDLEEAQALLDQALVRMRLKIHQFGGTLARVQGDGVMAIFGAPVPMEDHALRACCAAHAMCEEFRALTPEAHPEPQIREIRVGVHSGRALIRVLKSDRGVDYDAVGPDVHLAAKAEQQASPNGAMITGEARALAGSAVVSSPKGALNIGSARNVALFDLRGLSFNPDIDRQLGQQGAAPFVGRQKLLQQLIGKIDPRNSDAGTSIAIVGEAGIGKTRLVYEVARAARVYGIRVEEILGISVLQHTPFAPLRPFISRLLGCPASATEAVVVEAAGKLGIRPPLRPGILEALALTSADPEWAQLAAPTRRQVMFDAIAALVESIAARQPLLILVEDLHYLDLESSEFLSLLKTLSGRLRLSILMTARQVARQTADAASQDVLELMPLSKSEAQHLCRVLTPDGAILPGATIERAVERASGNPFFLEEVMRTQSTSPSPDDDLVSLGIASLVQSRMAALSPAARRVIQAASVLAGEIDKRVLALTSQTAEADLAPILDELGRENLLDVSSAGVVRFRHDLFRGGARIILLRAEAAEMHARAAQAFEAISPGTTEVFERFAYHAERSGQIAKALEQLLNACRLSVRTSSLKTVRAIYDWAMRLRRSVQPDARGVLLDILVTSLDALQQSGDPEEYERALQMSIEMSGALGNRLYEGIARSHYAVFNWMRARHPQARLQAESALKIALEMQIYPMREIAQAMVATVQHASGDLDTAIATFEDLLEAGSDQDPTSTMGRMFLPSVRSRAFLAHFLTDRGRFGDAQRHLDAAEQILGSIDQPYSRALLTNAQGRLALRRGEAHEAVRFLDLARETCLKHQLYGIEAGPTGLLASALVKVGEADRGRAVARYSIYNKLYRQCGRYGWVYVFQGLAEAEFACDNIPVALENIDQAVAFASENNEPIHIAQTRFARGMMLKDGRVGKPKHGQEDLAAALQLADKHGLVPLAADCHAALARLAKQLDQNEAMNFHANRANSLCRELGLPTS